MRQAEFRDGQYLDVLMMSATKEWVFGELGSGDARATEVETIARHYARARRAFSYR
jgi:hypothetical protein